MFSLNHVGQSLISSRGLEVCSDVSLELTYDTRDFKTSRRDARGLSELSSSQTAAISVDHNGCSLKRAPREVREMSSNRGSSRCGGSSRAGPKPKKQRDMVDPSG